MAKLYGQRKKKRSLISRFRDCVKSFLWLLNPRVFLPPLLFMVGILGFLCYSAFIFSSMEPIRFSTKFTNGGNWSGEMKINNDLLHVRRIHQNRLSSPKALAFNYKREKLYVAEASGRISVIKKDFFGQPGMGAIKQLSYTYGNPVGMRRMMGMLWVADSYSGVYTVEERASRQKQFLNLSIVEPPIHALADITMGHTGMIFLVDSGLKYTTGNLMSQILEGSCTGRVIVYQPTDGKTHVVKSGLCSPTSLELTASQDHIMVAEAGRGRVIVINLEDSKVTHCVYFPGIPGKLRANKRSSVWLSLQAVNVELFDYLWPRLWLRKIIGTLLPQFCLRSLLLKPHVAVMEIHQNATPIDSLQDPSGSVLSSITDVVEGPDGLLFFASDNSKFLGKIGEKNVDKVQPPEAESEDGSLGDLSDFFDDFSSDAGSQFLDNVEL